MGMSCNLWWFNIISIGTMSVMLGFLAVTTTVLWFPSRGGKTSSPKKTDQHRNAIVIEPEVFVENNNCNAGPTNKEIVTGGGGHGNVYESEEVKWEEFSHDINMPRELEINVKQQPATDFDIEPICARPLDTNDAVNVAAPQVAEANDEQPIDFDIGTICRGPLNTGTAESSRYAHELLKAIHCGCMDRNPAYNADLLVIKYMSIVKLLQQQFTSPPKRPASVSLERRPSSLTLGKRPVSLDRLPPGVTAHFDPKTTSMYYYNSLTGTSSWNPPKRRVSFIAPPTPEGYSAHQSPSGKTYYYNLSTGESTWKVHEQDVTAIDFKELLQLSRDRALVYVASIMGGSNSGSVSPTAGWVLETSNNGISTWTADIAPVIAVASGVGVIGSNKMYPAVKCTFRTTHDCAVVLRLLIDEERRHGYDLLLQRSEVRCTPSRVPLPLMFYPTPLLLPN